jgi:uncharacterized protein
MQTRTAVAIPYDQIAEFCNKWRVVEFSLFGSVLRDDFGPESDIDVMVSFDLEARPTLFDLAQMQGELEHIFARKVDLGTRPGVESSRNPLRRKAILDSARVIYGA